MNLKTFHEQKRTQKSILIFSIIILFLFLGIIFFRSFALYEQKYEYDAIRGKVPTLSDYNVTLSVLVDGVTSETIPAKGSGKTVEKITCDDGIYGIWDYEKWNLSVQNIVNRKTKCQIEFKSKYLEDILNGTDPVLKDGLIPVVLEDNGSVRKANLESEWYRYEDKRWANAVILEDESIDYQDGEVIPTENIESYFVWIPRYRYQIFDNGLYYGISTKENKAVDIQIEFERKEKLVSTGTKKGEWLTHPAFTAFDVNGIWVGKYTTRNKIGSGDFNIIAPDQLEITLSRNIWHSIDVSKAFQNSYDYKREYDSHMMKNTEWGAVAYLSHSKYGNVLSDFTSTTGNISGFYLENFRSYVMGVMADKNGRPLSGTNANNNSGFNGPLGSGQADITDKISFPESKYYDLYSYNGETSNFTARILGDATGEMGPFAINELVSEGSAIGIYVNSWHDGIVQFPNSTKIVWFERGGSSLSTASKMFSFDGSFGCGFSGHSFRVVLAF